MRYNLISVENFSVSFGNEKILGPLSLEVETGQIYALIGESGSGKTLFLKSILELLFSEHGWSVEGKIEKVPGLRIGWVAQNPSFQLFHNFVYEELGFDHKERALRFLEDFGIGFLSEKRSAELSQGEKAMVSLARAFSKKPGVMLLDEVMVNLSGERRKWFSTKLKEFVSSGGSVLLVEHTPEVLGAADEIILFSKKGIEKITQESAAEILSFDVCQEKKYAVSSTVTEPLLKLGSIRDERIELTRDRDWNMEFFSGEIVGISGGNGCGKTSFLELLAGFRSPGSGKIFYRGKKWKTLKERKRKLGFVAQEPWSQFFCRTVSEEFEFSGISDKTEITGFLGKFSLTGHRDEQVSSLSYGEQQRLALALLAASDCEIMLLDEPTYGMDRDNMKLFCRVLEEERSSGKLILFASHDLPLLEKICSRIVRLSGSEE